MDRKRFISKLAVNFIYEDPYFNFIYFLFHPWAYSERRPEGYFCKRQFHQKGSLHSDA